MEEQELRLTPRMLRTIGEDTKIRILKELSTGPRMPTDISRKLNKSAPTIIEHLEKLVDAGLVERQQQPGKKYVFYTLTQTGMGLVANKSRLSIVLYSSIVMFIIGISLAGIGSYNNAHYEAAVPSASPSSISAASTSPLILLDTVSMAVLVVAFILLLLYARKSKQMSVRISD